MEGGISNPLNPPLYLPNCYLAPSLAYPPGAMPTNTANMLCSNLTIARQVEISLAPVLLGRDTLTHLATRGRDLAPYQLHASTPQYHSTTVVWVELRSLFQYTSPLACVLK